jgi:hypothetical protein
MILTSTHFQIHHLAIAVTAEPVIVRATRNCYWDMQVWMKVLLLQVCKANQDCCPS